MKERFKKKITAEILQKDMTDRLHFAGDPSRNGNLFAAVILAVVGIFFGLMIGTTLIGLSIVIVMGCLAGAAVLAMKGQSTQIKSVPLEKMQLFQDVVIRKEKIFKRRGDYYEYYLIFDKTGRVIVPLEERSLGFPETYPAYKSTDVGETFFVARYMNPEVSNDKGLVFYPTADWRLRDLTAEQIAEEIRQEDDLIDRLIVCNRFPWPKMRKEHFQESPHAFWVPWEKTREEQNVLDRFAVQYFNRDLVSALEFIELYCPWELQDAAQQQYSPAQYRLLELVEKYAETDKTRKNRQDRINEVKETLFRSDHYD